MHFPKIFISALLGLGIEAFAVQAYEWGNVRFDGGGFVSAVLPSSLVEGLVYARTDVGGVYRYESSSGVWVPLMDFISQEDVGLYGAESFALDPTDPAKLYVLAGTGYFSGGRTAIFRSSDYGKSFDTSYVEFLAHGNGLGRQTGEKLAVDPNSPNILLCGSRSKGLYKSEDYGKTWSSLYKVALSSATENGLVDVNGISFVLFDSSSKLADGSTATVYMGISQASDNFLVSADGGKSWTVIEGGPSGLMPHRAKFAGSDLIITFADGPGPHSINSGAVYRYSPATKAWTDITPFDDKGSARVTYPFGGVTVDPSDAKHIVVTTICHYGGRYLYADGKDGWGDKIYVTTDGGSSWHHGQGYNDGVNTDAGDNLWISGNAIHWASSVEFDPFDVKRVWVTSGNGVFRTDDISATVPVWKFASKGIEETVPLDIVSVPGGPLVTAIGDYDGAVYSNILESAPRHSPSIGSTQSMAYAPLSGSLLRTGTITVYGQNDAVTYSVMYRSDDLGATWDSVKTTLKGSHGLVVLSADGSVMLHRPENSSTVYRSADLGATWTAVVGLDGQASSSRIVADPENADVFYAVDAQGYVLRSSDKGENFTKLESRLQNDASGEYYNGGGLIRTVPGKGGHLWVPLDQSQAWLSKGYSENGLAYTEDGGESWTRCEGASTAVAVGIGKADSTADYETIFIWGAASAKDPIGIYRSTDKCKTFERINDDAHQYGGPGNGNFVIGDMNHFGVVYMSTVGRGVVVGAPENSGLPLPVFSSPVKIFATLRQERRNLRVSAPAGSVLLLFRANGELCLQKSVGMNSSVSLARIPSGSFFAKVVSANGSVLLSKTLSVRD